MNAGENPHRHVYAGRHRRTSRRSRGSLPSLSSERFGGYMRQIEINLIFAADAFALETDLKYLAGRDVARNEISVCRIFFLEEIPALGIGDFLRISRIHRESLGTQTRPPSPRADSLIKTKFVFAGDRGRMNLNKFAVRIFCTLLITGRQRHCPCRSSNWSICQRSVPARPSP